MRLTPKTIPVRSKAPAKAPTHMERVLEACAELQSFNGEVPVLRQRIADSAREIFQGVVAGMMVRDGETYLSATVCTTDDPLRAKALMEHARSFATQAIEQERQLNFQFSYRLAESEAVYHGLAQPILTTGTIAVLVMVRSSIFAPAEGSAFGVMGNIARMA